MVEAVRRAAVARVEVHHLLRGRHAGESVDLQPPVACRLRGDHLSAIAVAAEVGDATAVVGHLGVGGAVREQDGLGRRRPRGAGAGTRVRGEAAARTRDRGDEIRSRDREGLGHHRAVGAARHEHPGRREAVLAAHALDEGGEEPDVVRAARHAVVGAAVDPAVLAVGGRQSTGIDHDEALAVGHSPEHRQRMRARVGDAESRTAAAVQHEHQRFRCSGECGGNMHAELARGAADREALVAEAGGVGPRRWGWRGRRRRRRGRDRWCHRSGCRPAAAAAGGERDEQGQDRGARGYPVHGPR